MPIDPTPEGAELLHQPVVKPFPEPTPKEDQAHQAHHERSADDDGHNHDAGELPGVASGANGNPALGPVPPLHG